MINIRPATTQDITAMMSLIRELALYEKAPEEVTVSDSHFEESLFGEKPVCWAFVAESAEQKVVGLALYYIRYSTWKGQRMYLEDIVVAESYRGKGIGKMLMDKLIEEGKTKKFSGMVWQVLDWNVPAINFYKKYNATFDGEWLNAAINFE